jgi:hypothetical protein
MSSEEVNATVAKLASDRKAVTEKRLLVVERIKQIATALHKLARAIDRKPDFDEVCRDSILQEYLDLSKIAALVLEEQELSRQQEDLDDRWRALGF